MCSGTRSNVFIDKSDSCSFCSSALEQFEAESGGDENADDGACEMTAGKWAAAVGQSENQFRDQGQSPECSENSEDDFDDFHAVFLMR